MNRFFIYCRKSTDAEDRQVLSIESQTNELQELAEKQGQVVLEVLTEARSAKAPGRRVFNEMMQRIYRGEAQGIVCWKLDRLARNPVDGGAIIWATKQHGIKIITPTQTYSQDEDNTILMYIEFGMAQKYIDDLSRNVKRGLKTKVESGWRPGIAPLGYLNDREGVKGLKQVRKDPERFPLVRKMWDLMLTGTYTVSEILRLANEKWGLRMRRDRREKAQPLTLSGIYSLLKNPFYYGEFEYPAGSGLWYKGHHEPMITREEYQRVQMILGRPGRPRPQVHSFAFIGLIRCGECGAMVTAEEKWKKQKNGNVHHYIYYHCTGKKDPHCSQRSIEEKELARQIETFLSGLQISERFKEWAVKYLHELHDREVADRSSIYQNLQKTYNDAQKGLDELIRMKYRGLLEDEEYERERNRLKLELARLKERLEDTEYRAERWLELAEKTFEFVCHARSWFAQGELQAKKQILEAVGSNLFLKDKKLTIEAKKPFLIIGNGLKGMSVENARFEPLENGVITRKAGLFSVRPCSMSRIVEEVRTCFKENHEGMVIPIFSTPILQATLSS